MNPIDAQIHALPAAISLLSAIIEHKRRMVNRSWEKGCYEIGERGMVRIGRPQLEDPEVQLILKLGLVCFIPTSSNPSLPESVLRMLEDDIPRAQEIIRRYTDAIANCNPKQVGQGVTNNR